jgi:hypothetical protein
MVEATLVLDGLTVTLLIGLIVEKLRNRNDIDDRLNDIVDGLGVFANEMIARTEDLKNLKDFMPDISLVNQNPLASLGEFIKSLRGINDNFPTQDFTKPRDDSGQYAATPQIEETAPTHETVDVTN